MQLTTIRAGFFGVLLVTMGLVNLSLPANSQTLFSLQGGMMRIPKPEQVPKKPSFVFRASEFYLAGATAFDMTTTVDGSGLGHPTTAYRSDGSFLTHYYVVEKGWAGFLGRRDPWTAVGANVIKNAVIDRYTNKLYALGGRWRPVAIGVNVLTGTLNALAAGSNIRSGERIDQQVRLATGYKGKIVW
jgi:hypothetical protein